MKKTILLSVIALVGIVIAAIAQSAPDPGKPDIISMDSLSVKPGQDFVMSIKVLADDTTLHGGKKWVGVGSFCIPIRYDARALKLDSASFEGTIAEWDESFTNQKIDTGFISFAGIHNIAGNDNPVFISPDKPQEIVRIFGRVKKDARPGIYTFELTIDPIQKNAYLGSIDGVNGWKPSFIPGKIVIK
ncbi:MAG: hypothetical protein A2W25_01975 [candidate division Zixibacteria bacterium RBG_16_53_22]|nr:MAG: hypothetical protein A2W25_01975 [candidate division Zixibacteria bacterium RBG_16_53_22]